jgi:hypothetical protein
VDADHFLDDVRRAVHVGTPRRDGYRPVLRDFEAERGEDALLLAVRHVDAAEIAGKRRIIGQRLALRGAGYRRE